MRASLKKRIEALEVTHSQSDKLKIILITYVGTYNWWDISGIKIECKDEIIIIDRKGNYLDYKTIIALEEEARALTDTIANKFTYPNGQVALVHLIEIMKEGTQSSNGAHDFIGDIPSDLINANLSGIKRKDDDVIEMR